ncbi:MAG TPA: transposase family protein [Anaerolineales bacterium]|nr:transposase family protein [Anaerolineales bacterium]
MVTYQRLRQHPSVTSSLIGMSLSAFDKFYAEFETAHEHRLNMLTVTKRRRQRRQRAVGAGRRYRYDLRDRLLMTLFWLRVYMTYEVLGFFYDLDKTNIEDNLKAVLMTLEQMTTFTFDRPDAERSKLRSPEAVMDAFPAVRLVIDAKEQRIQRPKNPKGEDGKTLDRQKPYYSGKKKAHTLKNQVGVCPTGKIDAVSESVPGSTHDLTLLRQTKLVDQLAPEEAAMLDKGYDGLQNDYPDQPLVLPYKARRNHPLTDEQKAFNRFLSKYRIVVEHTLAQMNKFAVVAQVFRHALDSHSRIFRIVAGLVNRRIEVKPLKTYAVV